MDTIRNRLARLEHAAARARSAAPVEPRAQVDFEQLARDVEELAMRYGGPAPLAAVKEANRH